MGKFFNLDGPLFAVFQKIADLFLLNIAFLICCIPIFTIGPATSALYAVTMEMIRKENNNLFKSYFGYFKKYFPQSFIVEIIFIFVGAFLYFDYCVFGTLGQAGQLLQYVILVSAIYYLFALMYVFCVIPVFDNRVKNALRNAFVLPYVHLPWTLLTFAFQSVLLYASLHNPDTFFRYWIIPWICIGFAFVAYISSFMYYRAFMRYFPEWEEEYQKDLEELHQETTKNDIKNGHSK